MEEGASLGEERALGQEAGSGEQLMRLHKYLARSGVESRRGAERLIVEGRVRVNGLVVCELGSKVDPRFDRVTLDGKPVQLIESPSYIMLNKPKGYVSTMDDPQGRPCVADLVPLADFPGLYHVGRLDRQTSGLLLFTTDGQLGDGLLHPRNHVNKKYRALVEGMPDKKDLARLRTGIELDGAMTAPAQVEVLSENAGNALLLIEIHEGRYRQVRRMCSAVGHICLDLERISFGPLSLGDLGLGQWRELTTDEVSAIKLAAGQSVLE